MVPVPVPSTRGQRTRVGTRTVNVDRHGPRWSAAVHLIRLRRTSLVRKETAVCLTDLVDQNRVC